MANFGESFSSSFIGGYNAGKAIRDDWAARDLKDDLAAADEQSKKDLEAGLAKNQQAYDDYMSGVQTYDPAEAATAEKNYDASMQKEWEGDRAELEAGLKSLYKDDPEGYKRALANADALSEEHTKARSLGYKEANTALKGEYEAKRNLATSRQNEANSATRADARKKKEDAYDAAYRKYYGTTGKTEKLAELDELKKFRDLANNPDEMKAFLLEEYNSKLPNGEKMLINKDGTLVRIDANGRQMGEPIAMPSMSVQRQMLANAMADRLLFSPNAAVAERALKYSELQNNRAKLEAAALKDASQIRLNNTRADYYEGKTGGGTRGGTGGGGGSGGVGAKYTVPRYTRIEDDQNAGPVYEVHKGENGQRLGLHYPNQGLLVKPGSTLADVQAQRDKIESATNKRATLVFLDDPTTGTIDNVVKDTKTDKLYPSLGAYQQALSGGAKSQAKPRALTSADYEKKQADRIRNYLGSGKKVVGKKASVGKTVKGATDLVQNLDVSANAMPSDDALAKAGNFSAGVGKWVRSALDRGVEVKEHEPANVETAAKTSHALRSGIETVKSMVGAGRKIAAGRYDTSAGNGNKRVEANPKELVSGAKIKEHGPANVDTAKKTSATLRKVAGTAKNANNLRGSGFEGTKADSNNKVTKAVKDGARALREWEATPKSERIKKIGKVGKALIALSNSRNQGLVAGKAVKNENEVSKAVDNLAKALRKLVD